MFAVVLPEFIEPENCPPDVVYERLSGWISLSGIDMPD